MEFSFHGLGGRGLLGSEEHAGEKSHVLSRELGPGGCPIGAKSNPEKS